LKIDFSGVEFFGGKSAFQQKIIYKLLARFPDCLCGRSIVEFPGNSAIDRPHRQSGNQQSTVAFGMIDWRGMESTPATTHLRNCDIK
jgi:hypothetical protein